MKSILFLLLSLFVLQVSAQNYILFKPGAYKKGAIVQHPNGTLWIAERDMVSTTALPAENIYWKAVAADEPIIIREQKGIEDPVQQAINQVPEFGRKTITLPDNVTYYMLNTLVIKNRGIHLIGGANTKIYFPQGVSGLKITRTNSSAGKSSIKNLLIRMQGAKDASKAIGVEVNAIVRLENIIVQNFSSHGFYFYAAVEYGQDCSGSSVYDCEAGENGGDGFRMEGPDANQIAFYSCNARDNKGWGFADNSFLGCQNYAGMTHANAKGQYLVGGESARGGLFGAYGEGDSPRSKIFGMSNVVGGLHENGIDVSRYSQSQLGVQTSASDYGWRYITRNNELINDFSVHSTGKGNLEYKAAQTAISFFQAGGQFTPPSTLELWDDVTRRPTFAGIAMKDIFIANRLVTFARSVEDLKKWGHYNSFQFIPGDKVFNSDYNGTNDEGWTCIKGGLLGKAEWKAF